jgi:hypothetical protein
MDAMHEFGHQDEAFIRGNDFSIQNGYIEILLSDKTF